MNFARDRFGLEPRGFTSDFVDASEVLQLSVPWSLYHYRVQGASVADWYLEEQGARLSRARRAWLAAQQASWLSIWEVIEVEVGATLTLRDLLSDERRFVEDSLASQTLVARMSSASNRADNALPSIASRFGAGRSLAAALARGFRLIDAQLKDEIFVREAGLHIHRSNAVSFFP